MYRELVVLLLLIACASGCRRQSETDIRMRQYFKIPAGSEISARVVKQALIKALPVGSGTKRIYTFIQQSGLGGDGLSACEPATSKGVIYCSINPDLSRLKLLDKMYSIVFVLDARKRLESITVEAFAFGFTDTAHEADKRSRVGPSV